MKKQNNRIINILMSRDGMTYEEAKGLFDEAQAEFYQLLDEGAYMSADDICEEYFGLEPDYMEDLL